MTWNCAYFMREREKGSERRRVLEFKVHYSSFVGLFCVMCKGDLESETISLQFDLNCG